MKPQHPADEAFWLTVILPGIATKLLEIDDVI